MLVYCIFGILLLQFIVNIYLVLSGKIYEKN